MMTAKEAASLLARAKELPHGCDLAGYTVADVMAKCNGVGAAWMDKVKLVGGMTMTDLANRLFSWAVPASVRHDLYYDRGGTALDRREDDLFFLEDCLWLARSLYDGEHWYNPMRYVRYLRRRKDARRMYVLLRAFGWLAYRFVSAEDMDNEEWISGERAKVAQATLADPENGGEEVER